MIRNNVVIVLADAARARMNAVNAAAPVSTGKTADDLLTDLLLQNQLTTESSSADTHIYQTPRRQQQQQVQVWIDDDDDNDEWFLQLALECCSEYQWCSERVKQEDACSASCFWKETPLSLVIRNIYLAVTRTDAISRVQKCFKNYVLLIMTIFCALCIKILFKP